MKNVSWVYYKRSGDYVINFLLEESQLYYDWFIKIRNQNFVIGINIDTMGEDYD